MSTSRRLKVKKVKHVVSRIAASLFWGKFLQAASFSAAFPPPDQTLFGLETTVKDAATVPCGLCCDVQPSTSHTAQMPSPPGLDGHSHSAAVGPTQSLLEGRQPVVCTPAPRHRPSRRSLTSLPGIQGGSCGRRGRTASASLPWLVSLARADRWPGQRQESPHEFQGREQWL